VGRERNRDIQNILAVLGSAVLCAGLLALFFLYFYGPSGRYLAGRTILDPAIIDKINDEDKHPRQKVHVIFDHIEFSYFDPQGIMRHQTVPLKDYQQFYYLIASEKSLDSVTDKIIDFFLKSHPTVLTMSIRTIEGSEKLTTKIFQIVQFVQEDYFRVQLHDKNEEGEWAYFYQPHLYHKVMHLFTQSPNL
jgi:hypothetical protein